MKIILFLFIFFKTVFLFSEENALEKHILNNFSIPDKKWAVYLAAYENGFSLVKDIMDVKKERRNFELIKKIGNDIVSITGFIEPKPLPDVKNSKDCKNYYLEKIKKMPLRYANLAESKYRGMFIVGRDVFLNPEDKSKISKNINVFNYIDDYCIDIHISKTLFRKCDSASLNKIINTIKIISPYSNNIYDYYNFGNIFFYYARDYKTAINYYEKAIEMDKNEKKLGKKDLISAIDNSGMAYAMMKDYKTAIFRFNSGLSKFTDYPSFYYNRSCAFAELGEREKALLDLELALKNRDKLLKGERFPDPSTDLSFKSIRDDYRFINLLKKYRIIKD